MPDATTRTERTGLDPAKFRDPDVTADGSQRAAVELTALRTLWFNTGTLCNLACVNCYIESSPTNDALIYLSAAEADRFLDELDADFDAHEIGFTGGEPFMNPEFMTMLGSALDRGYQVLVLTNAMRPMMKCADELLALKAAHGERLRIRVSIDHYSPRLHDLERGERAFRRMLPGLDWLAANGFHLSVAGRTFWSETEARLRDGFRRMLTGRDIALDTADPERLVLFPEMDMGADVPEITTACWGILDVSPEAMMCATSRMVVHRKGEARAVVAPCTLLPYDERLQMGETLAEASGAVKLNHPHCAKFCVLGGGSCSKA
ncbi:MAG: radical SAM protein [Minwuia sp.]|uniref:radical SAM protein n=1 Tax=Minwuia sp. TaxID=2493630 RepID=UPI003A8B3C19